MTLLHRHSSPSSLRSRIVSGRVTDATTRHDPTGTSPVARSFRAEAGRRVAQLRRLVREFLLERDHLGITETTVGSLHAGATDADKISAFARWVKSAITATLLERDGAWIAPFVRRCCAKGARDAARRAGVSPLPPDEDSLATLLVKYRHELDGIADVTEQQAVRALGDGLRVRDPASRVLAAVLGRLDAIGRARTEALAAFACADAYNTAALDAYEAAGVARVGIIPERLPGRRLRSDAIGDAKKPRYRQGSKTIVPSRRTVQRIRRRERVLEEKLGRREVDVLTAEDDLVCEECEDISDGGPYDIDEARGLIPAHPNCRCAFVPHVEEE